MRKLPCLALLAVCYCINVEALWSAEPLTRLSDLRALSMDEAGNGRQVSVEGTVLGLEPSAPFHFFIHDGTAGCFTKTRPGGRPGSLKAGDRVRINGVSDALGYYPSVKDASVTVVGIGMPPQPARPQPGEMFAPGLDSEWVEVPATVTGFDLGDDRLTLTVEVYGQTFKAEMPMFPGAGKRAADLVQRPVLLRGVLGTIFNSQRQMTDRHFFVPSLDSVIPTTPHADGGNSPLLEVARLLTAGYGPETPVKVRGIVTQQESQGFHMRDGSGSTLVHTGVADRLETGTLVEIEGFGVVSPFRPTLRATRVTRLGMENVRPLRLDPNTTDLSGMQSEWVTLDADFLGKRYGPSGGILQFSAQNRFFEAMLPRNHQPDEETLAPGDIVRVTGICELTTTHALPRPAWVDGFRIQLPNKGGMSIIKRAPWWNTKRLLGALGVTSGIAALGALATFMLRRQVARQMDIISGKLRAEAVSGERDRMARELHDSLEQQLSGVALQLDGLDHAFRHDPDRASSALQLARRMLRYTRLEARRSVWDLRSKVLEEKGLSAALQAIAEGAAPNGPGIQVQATGEPRRLATGVEFHLLRIAQEATTNAIKHSGAATIRIHLDYQPHGVSINILDDGHGFDANAANLSGTERFGLLGMHERSAKIGGVLTVESSQGNGCSVTITVNHKNPSHPE